jgi:S1-C subfamily serine protease
LEIHLIWHLRSQQNCKCQSKKYKHTREHGAIESFIQTDAAVNPEIAAEPGNIRGKLIGIKAIATPTGVYAGYAFAIPVDIKESH